MCINYLDRKYVFSPFLIFEGAVLGKKNFFFGFPDRPIGFRKAILLFPSTQKS